MTKYARLIILVVCILFSIAISACSSKDSDESTTVSLEMDTDDITTLGEFPVGIRDYTPAQVKITSPSSVNPVTTIANDETPYLKEIVPGEKWALEIKGEVAPSTYGIEGQRLEIKSIYVNWQLVDTANGDVIGWADGKFTFTKTIYITKENIADTFYSVVVAAVDEKNYVAGAKSVLILQDKAANTISDPLVNAMHVSGNKEFVTNALSIMISQLDGQNLAPSLTPITLLDVNILVPRTVMMQGMEILDYSMGSVSEGVYDINLDVKVSNLVIEYTNKLSVYKKGQNVININMKDIEIDGLIIELRNEDGQLNAYLKVGDIGLVKGEDFEYNLDTPFTELFNYLLDNIFSVLINDILPQLNLNPVQIKVGYMALGMLIKQLTGNEEQLTSISSLNYLMENSGGFRAGMNLMFSKVEREGLTDLLTESYSSLQAKNDYIDLAVNYGNSSVALSDDYINQLLAMNFVTDPDAPQEIADLDLNELIEESGIDLGDYTLWDWLRDADGKLPNVKIKFSMPTPPVLKISGDGDSLGSLYVRNVLVEIYELDAQGLEVELLSRLSISLDIAVKWEDGKFVLECGKGDATYNLLFNKLYPMFIPEQLKEIHTYIANSLNQFLNKLELIGFPIKNASTLDGAYLVFSGELGTDLSPNGEIDTSYSSLWARQSLSSNQGSDTRMINGLGSSDDILTSIFFRSIDDSGNVIGDMDWNDSCGYFYDLSDTNYIITGISFNKDFVFDYITGNSVEFYEEFAVMCVAYGNAAASDTDEFVPGTGCAIPYEFSVEAIPSTIKVPLCDNIGIGIRVKKDPTIPLKTDPIAIKTAMATGITIKYIDLSLDLGLNF